MVEQNGGKFRRLEIIIKNTAFGGNQNFFPGNVIALCVDSDEKIKHSLRKKFVKKNNFAGILGFDSLLTRKLPTI